MDVRLMCGKNKMRRLKRAAGSIAVRDRFLLAGLLIAALEKFQPWELLQPAVRRQRQPSRRQQEEQNFPQRTH